MYTVQATPIICGSWLLTISNKSKHHCDLWITLLSSELGKNKTIPLEKGNSETLTSVNEGEDIIIMWSRDSFLFMRAAKLLLNKTLLELNLTIYNLLLP